MRLTQSDWEYIDERAARFTGRAWVFERVRSFLTGPERLLLVCGPPGIGKTAVAARLAQATDGRVAGARSVVPPGSFDAALFCRAGRVDLLEAAYQLSDQLAETRPEFAHERRALVGEVNIQDVHVTTGAVAEGAQVTGVKIDLGRLPEGAFERGVALPLRRLAAGSRPAVLLVDALDEAFSAPTARALPRLLAELVGVKIVATVRDDPRVLAQLGDSVVRLHLLDDAPPDGDDVFAFLTDHFRGLGPDEGMRALAERIAGQAEGNFLYCTYVADAIVASGVLAGLDGEAAKRVPVPRGGLPGVYREFLQRELTKDENPDWSQRFRPVLAPLAVAYGDGLTASQLASVSTRLADRDISGSTVRDVIRIAGQFLQGPLPDGPFRPYHQSFAEFLTDAAQNPNWLINATETHAAIAAALIERVPKDQAGQMQWEAADAYTRTYLSVHAARAGTLDDLLVDPAYLLAAHPAALLGVLGEARSRQGRTAAAAYRHVAHRLSDPTEPSRASYLQLAALQAGAEPLIGQPDDAAADSLGSSQWRPVWGWWQPATPSRMLGRLSAAAGAVAAIKIDDGPLVVVGGPFGLEVWELQSARRLAFHPWKVEALAVGDANGRPVVLAGHDDGSVAVHALPSLAVLARDDSAHSGEVLAAAVARDGSVAATGDIEGTLVLWQLPTLERLATHRKAHTMVRDLSATELDGEPVLISAGDTLKRDGSRDPHVAAVRAWKLPTLDLLTEIDTGRGLVQVIEAVASPSGAVVLMDHGFGVGAHLIAADGTTTPVGTFEMGRVLYGCIVLQEGATLELLLVSAGSLTPAQIQLQPLPALTVGTPIEVAEGWSVNWAGPIETDRRILVSAATAVRVWDLDDVLATAAEQPAVPDAQRERTVKALAVAGEILAGVTTTGVVQRWRWRTGELLEPIVVSTEQIRALVSCRLGEREHLVVAAADGTVQAFDAESGERWPARIDAAAKLEEMAVGRYRGRVVAATAVKLGVQKETFSERDVYGVRLWKLETGEEIDTRSSVDRKLERLGLRDQGDITPGLTVAGWKDKRFEQLAVVETADELYIAALNSWLVRVWPLSDPEAEFDLEEGHGADDRIHLLSGGRASLVMAKTKGRLEVWRLDDRPESTYGGVHPTVQALATGLRHDEPVLLSGGYDGFLRVWSRTGGEFLSVELDEAVTAVAALGEDHVAVATVQGVLVLRLAEVVSTPRGPLEQKLDTLRAAVRAEYGSHWKWHSRNVWFPADAPKSHPGPAGAVAELVLAAPAASFRALSEWLEDQAPLAGGGATVADVACGLMLLYAHLAFDDLADILADADTIAISESSRPRQLLHKILMASPAAAAAVCERWSEADPRRAQLAATAPNWILWRSTESPPEVRRRLLAIQQRILDRNPTPQARTEALHGLFAATETRPLVMAEMLDRFRGKINDYASPFMVGRALETDFEVMLHAFEQRLMRNPARYDDFTLSALVEYAPASDAEAAAISTLLERLWDAGPGKPASELESSLLKFATHAAGALDRVVALAVAVAAGDPDARRYLMDEIVEDGGDPTLQRQLLDWVAETGDREIKGELLKKLADSVYLGEAPNPTLFEPILGIAGSELETQADKLMVAAQESEAFAAALARVVERTAPEQAGLLKVFAARIAAGIEPQRAAGEALEIYKSR